MMTRNPIATCGRTELTDGKAPDWVHLLPAGRIEARDGRRFVLDNPEGLLTAFARNGADLPVDYEHQSELSDGKATGPIPAAGWVKELATRPDGIWGRIEWTARARELIAAKEYRYISPVFEYDATSKAVNRLKGAGLVHSPALHLTALASEGGGEETGEETDDEKRGFIAELARLLGLPEDVLMEEVLERVSALVAQARAEPDPRRYVPIAAVSDLMRDRNERIASMSESQTRARVESAIARGSITPAMRGWATALCKSDPDSFDAFVSSVPPAFAHLGKRVIAGAAPPPGTGLGVVRSDAADAVCAQLGLKPGSLKE